MDLTNNYSLQPHLLSMTTETPSHQQQQQQQKPTQSQAPPLAPDAYVGMRLANSSSSSEDISLSSPPLPSRPRVESQSGAYTCAPEFQAGSSVAELTDIALDSAEPPPPPPAPQVSQSISLPFDDYSAYNNEDYGNDEGFDCVNRAANSADGLLNPSVVADIANDIRDIKRAIAQQRRPLPSVVPPAGPGLGRNVAAESSNDTSNGGGVWVRMPSPQTVHTADSSTQQQQQHPASPPIRESPAGHSRHSAGTLYEHSHPFYGNSGSSQHSNLSSGGSQNGHHSRPLSTASTARAPSTSAAAAAASPRTPESSSRVSPIDQDRRRHSMAQSESSADYRTADYDSDGDTDGLMQKQYESTDRRVEIPELQADRQSFEERRKDRGREVAVRHPDQPTVLIEGLLFRALYLGSTQLVSEGQPSKSTRMAQAQEAVGRIKAPEGEHQPCVPVDLFISTEKIMVLNTNLQEIMMDHALKTISYIADIGNVLVFMARRRFLQQSERRQTKIVCHVFETDEAQLVAHSIGQAFQAAYMEFLRANGIEDPGYQLRDMDYQDVLNQQDIIGEELSLFSRSETQKEVLVPKSKGEPLGVVIVESGWGSILPTVVLANMQPSGPAARCGQLNIGDQLLAINGTSLVGLPLATCQQHVRACKSSTAVKVRLVSCPPVVEVLIRRPDVKFQLGFSVQNGVICSLLRGGIAERGGVRVGHRIIEINGQSVVATPHDRIVAMLASGVGEIHMKTMPTSIFRLLTGQEVPHYI